MERDYRRSRVYEYVDAERKYQDDKWGGHEHDITQSPGDFMLYMHVYMQRALALYAGRPDDSLALAEVRKVTALGVACMELYGQGEPRIVMPAYEHEVTGDPAQYERLADMPHTQDEPGVSTVEIGMYMPCDRCGERVDLMTGAWRLVDGEFHHHCKSDLPQAGHLGRAVAKMEGVGDAE